GLTAPASAVPGAYGVYTLADTEIHRHISTGPDGTSNLQESWQLSSGGDHIGLQISYVRGPLTRSKADLRSSSAAKPEFYRIYRVEQASEVLRSPETTTDRIKEFSFKASGPKIGAIFDGSEQLLSVVAIPWYMRQIYLPGS